MILQRWLRQWCTVLAVVAGVMGWTMHADPHLFAAPAYALILDVMSLEGWAAAWCVVAVAAAVAAVTGRLWAWRTAAIGTMLIAPTWAILLIIQRVANGTPVSWVGISLWWWLVASNAIAVASPWHRCVQPSGRSGRG